MLDGFWLDVKLFVIVEVAVLAVGLALAVLRTSRAPAFFPFRLLTARSRVPMQNQVTEFMGRIKTAMFC